MARKMAFFDLTGWVSAIREYRRSDAPRLMALAYARRAGRIPPWRKAILPVSMFVAGFSFFALVPYRAITGGQFSLAGFLNEVTDGNWSMLLACWFFTFIPAYLMWLGQGVYSSLYAAYHYLGSGGARGMVSIDGCMAATSLSDRMLLLAGLVPVAKPLWRRTLVGAVLALATIILVGLENHYPSSMAMLTIYRFAPVTIGSLMLGGVIGSVVLVLLFMVLGRGNMGGFVPSVLSGLLAFQQVAWVPFTGYIIGAYSFSFSQWDVNGWLAGGYIVLYLALVGITALMSVNRPVLRTVLFYALPLIAVTTIIIPVAQTIASQGNTPNGELIVPGWWCWGAATVINTFAIPTHLCYGSAEPGRHVTGWLFAWPRFALLIATQVALLAMLLAAGERSVREHRYNNQG